MHLLKEKDLRVEIATDAIRKDANQLQGIRNWKIMANRREVDGGNLDRPGLDLGYSVILTDS